MEPRIREASFLSYLGNDIQGTFPIILTMKGMKKCSLRCSNFQVYKIEYLHHLY